MSCTVPSGDRSGMSGCLSVCLPVCVYKPVHFPHKDKCFGGKASYWFKKKKKKKGQFYLYQTFTEEFWLQLWRDLVKL